VSQQPLSQREFFANLAEILNDCGISFMVSGSLASSVHGEPRATNDLDLVIDPTADALQRFIDRLPAHWYASAEAAREALRRRTMFNIIDTDSGWKADLIVRKERPFSIEEFRRRTPAQILGTSVAVVSAEDSILSKLEWSRDSQSQRQLRDALGVAMQNAERLDRAYLTHWGSALGVADLLVQLLAEVDQRRAENRDH
jgi:hypothetical protein